MNEFPISDDFLVTWPVWVITDRRFIKSPNVTDRYAKLYADGERIAAFFTDLDLAARFIMASGDSELRALELPSWFHLVGYLRAMQLDKVKRVEADLRPVDRSPSGVDGAGRVEFRGGPERSFTIDDVLSRIKRVYGGDPKPGDSGAGPGR